MSIDKDGDVPCFDERAYAKKKRDNIGPQPFITGYRLPTSRNNQPKSPLSSTRFPRSSVQDINWLLPKKASRLIVAFCTVLFSNLAFMPLAQAQSVSLGKTLYETTADCESCHGTSPDSRGIKGSNDIVKIRTAIETKEAMTALYEYVPPGGTGTTTKIKLNDTDLLNLAVYIGQYKKPVPGTKTLNIPQGNLKSGTIDVYSRQPSVASSHDR